jgi:hypothetical protein
MGWINVHWGVPQVPNASTNLPHKALFALDKMCFLVPSLVHN